MPLNAEAKAKFNEKAAQDFFYQTEGVPYGYHNFLFGWIDTPEDNWPPILPAGIAPVLMNVLSRVAPSAADSFFLQAMNKRLGTVGLSDEQITAEAARRGLHMDEVMAMPEIDGW